MNKYTSKLTPFIESFLAYRQALGYSPDSHAHTFASIDRFYDKYYPEQEYLTKDIVLEWLEEQESSISNKATAVRLLGKYIAAVGTETYILPDKLVRNGIRRGKFAPYLFTDSEMSALFQAVDTMPQLKTEPFLHEVPPVLFRLIYTCGLRPGEGRCLKRENVNLDTGEIQIICSKNKKDRLVVMSPDMHNLCQAYESKRVIFAKGSEYFFPALNGQHMSNQQIGRHFSNCWKRANTSGKSTKGVRVYGLRHRFASANLNRWLDTGKDLNVMLPYLSAYMGHDRITDTLYYVHMLPENMVKSSGVDWAAFESIVPEVVIWPK